VRFVSGGQQKVAFRNCLSPLPKRLHVTLERLLFYEISFDMVNFRIGLMRREKKPCENMCYSVK